jgi:hypothetical protein
MPKDENIAQNKPSESTQNQSVLNILHMQDIENTLFFTFFNFDFISILKGSPVLPKSLFIFETMFFITPRDPAFS